MPSGRSIGSASLGAVFAFLTSAALSCPAQTAAPSSGHPDASTKAPSAEIEDVYVLRSLREARTAPSKFCAEPKIGFAAQVQDQYVFKSVVTRPSDGKIVDAINHPAGTLRACFGASPAAGDANFYAEGVLAGITATGKGKCAPGAANYPETGITSWRCYLLLSNLPPPYIGGLLTTNSIISRELVGPESNPSGYIQPSIATIRLWRQRTPP